MDVGNVDCGRDLGDVDGGGSGRRGECGIGVAGGVVAAAGEEPGKNEGERQDPPGRSLTLSGD